MGDEPERDVWTDPDPGAEGGERESIGSYLASQRRLRGISLDELATRTRIPRRNLERLETGAFDDQPDGFVRGFVRTVAAELGLDAQEAVMRLMGEPAAPDEEWRRRRRMGTALGLAAAAATGLGVVGWGLLEAARWVASPAPGLEEEWVYRRNAVQALWEAQRDAARPAPGDPDAGATAGPAPGDPDAGATARPEGAGPGASGGR